MYTNKCLVCACLMAYCQCQDQWLAKNQEFSRYLWHHWSMHSTILINVILHPHRWVYLVSHFKYNFNAKNKNWIEVEISWPARLHTLIFCKFVCVSHSYSVCDHRSTRSLTWALKKNSSKSDTLLCHSITIAINIFFAHKAWDNIGEKTLMTNDISLRFDHRLLFQQSVMQKIDNFVFKFSA